MLAHHASSQTPNCLCLARRHHLPSSSHQQTLRISNHRRSPPTASKRPVLASHAQCDSPPLSCCTSPYPTPSPWQTSTRVTRPDPVTHSGSGQEALSLAVSHLEPFSSNKEKGKKEHGHGQTTESGGLFPSFSRVRRWWYDSRSSEAFPESPTFSAFRPHRRWAPHPRFGYHLGKVAWSCTHRLCRRLRLFSCNVTL